MVLLYKKVSYFWRRQFNIPLMSQYFKITQPCTGENLVRSNVLWKYQRIKTFKRCIYNTYNVTRCIYYFKISMQSYFITIYMRFWKKHRIKFTSKTTQSTVLWIDSHLMQMCWKYILMEVIKNFNITRAFSYLNQHFKW